MDRMIVTHRFNSAVFTKMTQPFCIELPTQEKPGKTLD